MSLLVLAALAAAASTHGPRPPPSWSSEPFWKPRVFLDEGFGGAQEFEVARLYESPRLSLRVLGRVGRDDEVLLPSHDPHPSRALILGARLDLMPPKSPAMVYLGIGAGAAFEQAVGPSFGRPMPGWTQNPMAEVSVGVEAPTEQGVFMAKLTASGILRHIGRDGGSGGLNWTVFLTTGFRF